MSNPVSTTTRTKTHHSMTFFCTCCRPVCRRLPAKEGLRRPGPPRGTLPVELQVLDGRGGQLQLHHRDEGGLRTHLDGHRSRAKRRCRPCHRLNRIFAVFRTHRRRINIKKNKNETFWQNQNGALVHLILCYVLTTSCQENPGLFLTLFFFLLHSFFFAKMILVSGRNAVATLTHQFP